MKKSDLITAALIAILGTIVAFFLVNSILGDPSEKEVSFSYVVNQVGGANELSEPDPEVFNEDAINPTVEVYVGTCVDEDQNGEIDAAERVACGAATTKEVEEKEGSGGTSQEIDDIERTLREYRQDYEDE